MNQIILAKLKKWRAEKADLEKCELYRIFPNKTIEEIATLLPQSKEELLAIKGVGEKKIQKYGNDMLAIVSEGSSIEILETASKEEKDKIYSVSNYLDNINYRLSSVSAKIQGEISSFSFKGHLYFSIKDKNDGSVLSCFMWSRDYELCGIEIVEGMEIAITGFPEIYKPTGKFTFRTRSIELVGEGALKKAYEELKKKLDGEGLFDESRKRMLPDYPQRIGLITSRDGAVINDFLNNIGRFGFKIKFIDSRVEGMLAVRELVSAVRYFQENPVDVLVIIRGGGSLESLQAFNNESLIREIVKLQMPIICGIGHDKDVPLLSYVADKAVSTPSIAAKEINRSWEHAVDRLENYENNILNSYSSIVREARFVLDDASVKLRGFYQDIFRKFEYCEQGIKNLFSNIGYVLKKDQERLGKIPKLLLYGFGKMTLQVAKDIDGHERMLNQNNPERQLKLGYSILMLGGKVVKSVKDVKSGDVLLSKLSDGNIESQVK